MMNVLIVDDEPIIRIGLRTLIDWESNGFHLAGEASDGEEALTMMNQLAIDLLVTDIKMPGMDGLELIRRANECKPDIGIVVLSCLDDFGFVKGAMKLGARDYILKPTMEPEELVVILRAISANLTQERREKARIKELSERLEQSRTYRLQGAIRSFVEHGIADSGLGHELFKQGRKLYSMLLCASGNSESSLYEMEKHESLVAVRLQDNQHLLLPDCDRGIGANEWYQLGFATAERLLRQYFHVAGHEQGGSNRAVIYIGPPIQEIGELSGRLDFHRSQVCSRFYGRTRSGIYMDHPIPISTEAPLPAEHRNSLLRAVAGRNSEAVHSCMEEMMSSIEEWKPDLQRLHSFMKETTGLVIEYARDNGYANIQELEDRYKSFDFIAGSSLFEDLRKLMYDFVHDLCSGQSVIDRHTITHPFIRKAVAFIENNYFRNIGTTDIADYVKLSRSYLSDLYSKETGESLIETLMRVRIEQACKLLAGTDKKIYEIADEVGFNDSKTFTKAFKKWMNCTPKEYAESNK